MSIANTTTVGVKTPEKRAICCSRLAFLEHAVSKSATMRCAVDSSKLRAALILI